MLLSAILTDESRAFLNHHGGGPIWRERDASQWMVAVELAKLGLVEIDRSPFDDPPEETFQARCVVYERTERAEVHALVIQMAEQIERIYPDYTNTIFRRVERILKAADDADPRGEILRETYAARASRVQREIDAAKP